MNQERSVTLNSLAQGELLKSRSARALGKTGLALVLGVALGGVALAPVRTGRPSRQELFRRRGTSTKDGTLYAGSFNLGGVVKASPGGKTEQFIPAGAARQAVRRSVCWPMKRAACCMSVPTTSRALAFPAPATPKGLAEVFDLASGAPKGSFGLPDPKSLCNDIAVGSDGFRLCLHSFTPNVYRLKPGATALEAWATDPLLAPAKGRVGLDGIAVGADGNLYVTTFIPAKLFKIAVKDGKAGAVTELKTSRAIDHADAMRAFGDSFLLIEGAGRLAKVTGEVTRPGRYHRGRPLRTGLGDAVGNTGWVAEGKCPTSSATTRVRIQARSRSSRSA